MNNRMQDLGLLILRMGMGLSMLPHGLSKVSTLFSGKEIHFFDFLGLGPGISMALATLAEAGCSLLVVLGLKARWTALPVAFTMIVAGYVANFDSPWARKELATLYFIGFFTISILGPGKYSLDSWFNSSQRLT